MTFGVATLLLHFGNNTCMHGARAARAYAISVYAKDDDEKVIISSDGHSTAQYKIS